MPYLCREIRLESHFSRPRPRLVNISCTIMSIKTLQGNPAIMKAFFILFLIQIALLCGLWLKWLQGANDRFIGDVKDCRDMHITNQVCVSETELLFLKNKSCRVCSYDSWFIHFVGYVHRWCIERGLVELCCGCFALIFSFRKHQYNHLFFKM